MITIPQAQTIFRNMAVGAAASLVAALIIMYALSIYVKATRKSA